MNTLTAPENKYLTQSDNEKEPIIVKEVAGAGNLNDQYDIASDYKRNQILDNQQFRGGLYSWL